VERTALGILDIVTATMVRAIRAVSVERGHDPRDCVLMAYGGAGPLHARQVAAELGMRRVVVPAAPGILCAQGLVVADRSEELVHSRRVALDGAGVAALGSAVEALWPTAMRWFQQEAVAPAARAVELVLDMRYVGQNFELRVPVADAAGDGGTPPRVPGPTDLRTRFDAAHEQLYGFASPDDPVEAVNLRLALRGVTAPAPAPPSPAPAGAPRAAGQRRVHFAPDGSVDTAVFERTALRPGQLLEGPAIVEQLDTTTVIGPGDRARVDAAGNLLLDVGPGPGA